MIPRNALTRKRLRHVLSPPKATLAERPRRNSLWSNVKKLLLCDDEESLLRGLGRILRTLDFDVTPVDGPRGQELLRSQRYDVIVTDLRMPRVNGFEIISEAHRQNPTTPIIAMSGSAEIPDAVRAMRAGARDFLIKPFGIEALEEVLSGVVTLAEKPETPAPEPLDPLAWRDQFAPFFLGNDPSMLPVIATVSQVADTSCTILITGESGTGKELVARSIVSGSPRRNNEFVAVNCAAIPTELVESELFGHTKGAFTGATSTRTGYFARANKGTIFLDEIGEMDLGTQAKLLRIIQDGQLMPVGEERPVKVDVRVIAATNRDLPERVKAGKFREDLFWRLNVIPLEIPPLRKRPADVPLLVEHFVARSNTAHNRHVEGFDEVALECLKGHSWPGNIRELENLIERLVIVKGRGFIGVNDLPAPMRDVEVASVNGTVIPELPTDGTDLRGILDAVEDRMISEALERTGGNKNKAAELLGLNRTTLVEKLRRKRGAAASA